MAHCIYCGKEVGWFSKWHDECKEKDERELAQKQEKIKRIEDQMISLCEEAIISRKVADKDNYDTLGGSILDFSNENDISQDAVKGILIRSWENVVTKTIENRTLNEEIEDSLCGFQIKFNLSDQELDANKARSHLLRAGILRDIIDGKKPHRVSVRDGTLGINLQAAESLVYLFFDTEYYEDKILTTYEGSSQGISMKIANGLWYRIGNHRGTPVRTTNRVKVDQGTFIITTEHLYFNGIAKSFRVPYSKIIAFYPYEDGLGICQDKPNAKQQVFKTEESLFVYNLVNLLSKKNLGQPVTTAPTEHLTEAYLEHVESGIAATKEGNFQKAFDEYTKAVELNPKIAGNYSALAYVSIKQGDFAKGLPYCNKAIGIDPNYDWAYFNRAVIYSKLEDSEKALEDYNKVIEINPKYAEAYFNRAGIYTEFDNNEKALLDYNKAINIKPDWAEAHFNRAVLYWGSGQCDQSWEDVHKAEQLGLKVNVDFIKELKEKSGRDK